MGGSYGTHAREATALIPPSRRFAVILRSQPFAYCVRGGEHAGVSKTESHRLLHGAVKEETRRRLAVLGVDVIRKPINVEFATWRFSRDNGRLSRHRVLRRLQDHADRDNDNCDYSCIWPRAAPLLEWGYNVSQTHTHLPTALFGTRRLPFKPKSDAWAVSRTGHLS